MTAVIIGILGGVLVIGIISMLKHLDKTAIYALILSAIGFLYVGFTWTDTTSLILTCLQAVLFVFIAYFGLAKNLNFLVAGYFLHGIWDLVYNFFPGSNLIPPHYDLFCLSIDFTMGIYLLILKYWSVKEKSVVKMAHRI